MAGLRSHVAKLGRMYKKGSGAEVRVVEQVLEAVAPRSLQTIINIRREFPEAWIWNDDVSRLRTFTFIGFIRFPTKTLIK